MFVSLLVGAVVSLAANTPAPSAAPPVQSGPLREVVYNVTISAKNSGSTVQYEGRSSGGATSSDRGTVTVDVMAVASDSLGIEVIELMNSKGSPYHFKGSVAPDGTVIFEPASISDVTRELLQYFAPRFLPPDKISVGQSWTTNFDRSGAQVQTQYTITKVDGDLMTLHELQKVKFKARNQTVTTEGTIVIKPSVLAPISGDVRTRIEGFTGQSEAIEEITEHFERVSDNRDAPAK
jgi:hypothetical protein